VQCTGTSSGTRDATRGFTIGQLDHRLQRLRTLVGQKRLTDAFNRRRNGGKSTHTSSANQFASSRDTSGVITAADPPGRLNVWSFIRLRLR
jgi:hypothetical protein